MTRLRDIPEISAVYFFKKDGVVVYVGATLTESEVEAKAKVNDVMHKNGLETYLYTDDGDVEKECVLVESVKLRKIKADDDDE